MAAKRGQLALLGALLIVLAGVLWFEWPRTPAGGEQGAAPSPRPGTTQAPAAPAPARTVADVGLAALERPQPSPVDSGRNPFRFASRAREPVVPDGFVPLPPGLPPSGPVLPQGPPPPPPIPLKFIGLVDAPPQAGRLAVLSDGRNVFHGREGDIIDGRYRIVRIGVESIELSYLDGRGRQTIRLSGSG